MDLSGGYSMPNKATAVPKKRSLADSDREPLLDDVEVNIFGPEVKRTRMQHDSNPLGKHPVVLHLHRVLCDNSFDDNVDHTKHVEEALYLDCPRLFKGDDKASVLRGTKTVSSGKKALSTASIIVYKTYSCPEYLSSHGYMFEEVQLPELQEQFLRANRAHFSRLRNDGPNADATSIQVVLQLDDDLRRDMSLVLAHSTTLMQWQDEQNLRSPFSFYYHHKDTLRRSVDSQGSWALQQWTEGFLNCIDELTWSDHHEAREMFSQGLVDKKHFSKLFCSDEVIVTPKDGILLAYRVSEVQQNETGEMSTLQCWSYHFDGTFKIREITLAVRRPAQNDPVKVNSLEVFPLRLESTDVKKQLLDRGMRFWECRERQYVRYTAPRLPFEPQTGQARYMVDYAMYKMLHPETEKEQNVPEVSIFRPHQLQIDQLENLSDAEREQAMLLLPAHIQGFGFLDKKWRTLAVDYTKEVEWNVEAFEQLVLEKTKKDLVKALVTVHLKSRRGVDLIEGKGNGLIILLHGGPGTGKTLTAESVAEIAKKPLYRVTCGDMGIDPEGVEKYLDSVLHIGTVWDCVVLLDEADIFLERRTTEDIKRNALVSVFLRVLEYYDGILILTTNRIGLFDEAFKSRIQLSIHYPALDIGARSEVWLSALRAIPQDQVKCDIQKLLLHVPKLAKKELNGRQIRNTVHCAMQLAIFKEEPLDDSHFRTVIDITMEFERFIQDVRGEDDDSAARGAGAR